MPLWQQAISHYSASDFSSPSHHGPMSAISQLPAASCQLPLRLLPVCSVCSLFITKHQVCSFSSSSSPSQLLHRHLHLLPPEPPLPESPSPPPPTRVMQPHSKTRLLLSHHSTDCNPSKTPLSLLINPASPALGGFGTKPGTLKLAQRTNDMCVFADAYRYPLFVSVVRLLFVLLI